MQIRELLHDIALDVDFNFPLQSVAGLSEDSRKIQNDFVFFSIDGNQNNGSNFVSQAQKSGALCVVTETPLNTNLPQVLVSDVRSAFALCSARFYNHPSQNFYLCGITGTNGKTTTSYILKKIWGDSSSGLLGTIEVKYPGFQKPSPLTTLSSCDLHKTFFEMKNKATTHVVMEVSSHALDQKRTWGCHFDSAIFTNLTQDHMDYHKTWEHYFLSKKLLFTRELYSSQKTNRLAVVHNDGRFGQMLLSSIKALNLPCVTYSLQNGESDYCIDKYDSSLSGTEFTITAFGQKYSGHTNLIGEHNLLNILGALAVGEHSNFKIQNALPNLENISVPGRLEKIGSDQIFVDYAHTPDALKHVLESLQKLKPKNAKLILVFGCGGNRDKTKRSQMGSIAKKYTDILIITSDNPRFEDPLKIIDDVRSQILDEKNVYVEVDRQKAIEMALNKKSHNDIVLIAGKGHETFQSIQGQDFQFDDRKVIQDLL